MKIFWVVEQFTNGQSSGYWDGANSRSFISDIEKAVHFCRHEDALWSTRGWHWNDTQITEHVIFGFDSPPLPQDSNVIEKLQKALNFWLPDVPGDRDEISNRIEQDAWLLCGFDPASEDDEDSAEKKGWITLNTTDAAAVLPQEGEAKAVVPLDAINKLVDEAMEICVSNGADSRSMPDEYVAIAHFVCYPEEYGYFPTPIAQPLPVAANPDSRDAGHIATLNQIAGYMRVSIIDGQRFGAMYWSDALEYAATRIDDAIAKLQSGAA
ncbi:MAG: hypothetical protein JWP38_3684 [Herbaspirillum sp.]|nr:hypothetical protein [Herbaspirillum sp.]